MNSLVSQAAIWSFTICLLSFFLVGLVEYTTAYMDAKLPAMHFQFVPSVLIIYTMFSALLSKFISSRLLKPLAYFQRLIDDFNNKGKFSTKDKCFYLKELIELKEFMVNAFALQLEKSARDFEITRLSTQIAHDIRTPLLALESLADEFSDINKENAHLLRKISARLHHIVKSFLEITDKHSGDKVWDAQSAQADALVFPLVEEVVLEKLMQCKNTNVKIKLHINNNTKLICTKLNSSDFMRALANILDNAVQAINNKNGKVSIVVKKMHGYLRIEIKDTGCGIPDEKQKEIFEEGVSVDKREGYGYGLPYALRVIKAVNGDLEIQSEEEVGTTVGINLPALTTPNWLADECVIYSKVYIVDDDENILESLKKQLKGIHDHQRLLDIETYFYPEEFLRKYDKNKLATVFLDYRFANSPHTGVSFLREHKGIINGIVYMISNDYDSIALRNDLKELGVRLIPKPCLMQVKLRMFREVTYGCNPIF